MSRYCRAFPAENSFRGADIILSDFKLSIERRMAFSKNPRSSLMNEYNFNAFQRKRVSNKYYQARKEIRKIMNLSIDDDKQFQELKLFRPSDSVYLDTITKIRSNLKAGNVPFVYNWLSSYLHMFFNRIFVSDQTVQELVIYDYVFKHYAFELAQ